MKKTLLIIASIVALITIVVVGFGIYIINTPEYALQETIEDVNDQGMEGLYPHLTADARKTIDTVSSVTKNEFFNTIMEFISKSEYVSILISEIQEIQWGIDDVLKSKKNTKVILSFNYKDKLIGTIELSMLRDKGEWKISALKLLEFSELTDDSKNS